MKRFFLIGSLFFCFFARAQKQGQALVDSLLQELPKVTADTALIKLQNRLSDLYIDIDQVKALQYADSALARSKNIKWQKGIASAMLALGNVNNFNGNPSKAIDYLKDAALIFNKIGYKFGEAASINAIAKSYETLSDYPTAVNYYLQALKIHESIPNNDLRIGMSLSGIANIYYFQRDYKKALEYSFKALHKKELLKNKTSMANELYAIGDTYYEMSDSVNAEKYNLQALELYNTLGNKMGQANIYASLGKLYKKNHTKSLEYFSDAKKILTGLNDDSPSLTLIQGQVAQVFLDMVKYGDTLSVATKRIYGVPSTKKGLLEAAEMYLQKAIAVSKENEDRENEYIFSGSISEVQALQNDYKNAYLNLSIYNHLQDSLYSQENKNKIAAVEGEREVAIRDKEIEINKLALSNTRKTQWALIGGLLLLGIIGGLLFWQSQTRKKTNTALLQLNNELDEANKLKAKFFAILSHDFRGPVSRLVHFLHLQKADAGLWTAEQAAAHEKKITESAESLLENMEAMLTWSKGQMENFQPTMRNVAVSDLFTYLNSFFINTEKVQLIFKDAGNLQVTTDENYLQTIMHNLTSNAIKALQHTPDATIVWNAKQEGGKTILSITDNGPGISAEQAKVLQDDKAPVNIKGGLGFHLIKDLAKAIQCTILLHQRQEQGTSFSLSI
jgi:signal transduction histidine kinase